jgi:hypothetical protein
MLMLSLLSSGNLSQRQFNFSYHILCLVSNRMSLHPEYAEDASFAVVLNEAKPAMRQWRIWKEMRRVLVDRRHGGNHSWLGHRDGRRPLATRAQALDRAWY